MSVLEAGQGVRYLECNKRYTVYSGSPNANATQSYNSPAKLNPKGLYCTIPAPEQTEQTNNWTIELAPTVARLHGVVIERPKAYARLMKW